VEHHPVFQTVLFSTLPGTWKITLYSQTALFRILPGTGNITMYSHTLLFRILPGTRNITLFSQTLLFEYCLARGTSPCIVKLYCLSIAWHGEHHSV